MTAYDQFIRSKGSKSAPVPIPLGALPPKLFGFQRHVVEWALSLGRAAIFADCGLGKSGMQLAWADAVRQTGSRTLILAPLAVAEQTVGEGLKFGVDVDHDRDGSSEAPIVITNYERLHRFDPTKFDAIVLDESSILKSHDGKTRTQIIEAFSATRWRLACTATPSPNDHMELGNHAEFLGALSRTEMLSTFFVHDGGSTQKWRLKGHAKNDFWAWVCAWSIMVRRPSDLGFDDDAFTLPSLTIHETIVEAPAQVIEKGQTFLFAVEAHTLSDQRQARRSTIADRVQRCADAVNASRDPWIVWCDLNDEADAVQVLIPDSVQVAGVDSDEVKTERMLGFAAGKYRVLVTKPSICGFGMNFQICASMAFVGLSHSFEAYYQAVRRCWRFGQRRPVDVHIFTSSADGAIVRNIRRKSEEMDRMIDGMLQATASASAATTAYAVDKKSGEGWTMCLGDCVDVVKHLRTESIDFSIFSPPFASLYTYSASDRDMGNCRGADEFFKHFAFLVPELLRVTKPGRLLSFHCMDLPTSKTHHGYIGLVDFRGLLIRIFEESGWIFHSCVTIWKDPVTAMQRTKALGLLHKQLKKDSCMSRQGIPDYLVTMRKPGENRDRVTHTNETFPVDQWQRYASPVWMDIDPSDTLQHRSAREDADERHICPLQLEVIRRAMFLWTKPGDRVLSPFAGIGSEGVISIEQGRRFVGVELKRSYWQQACRNLDASTKQTTMAM